VAKGDGGSMTFGLGSVISVSVCSDPAEVYGNNPLCIRRYGSYMLVHYCCTDHMGFASSQRDVVVE
jgi:hypothetical protein